MVPKRLNELRTKNGRPTKFYVTTGAAARILTERLDERSILGRAEKERTTELQGQYGEQITPAGMSVLRAAVRQGLIADIAWADISERGVLIGGQENPAVNVLLRAYRGKLTALQLLGLERKDKLVPDLKQYLASRADDLDEVADA